MTPLLETPMPIEESRKSGSQWCGNSYILFTLQQQPPPPPWRHKTPTLQRGRGGGIAVASP